MGKYLTKLINAIKNPYRAYLTIKMAVVKRVGTPRQRADILYYQLLNKKINWKNPNDLNEWINWLEFKTDTTLWSQLADKNHVRDFIAERGFSNNLVPLLKVWQDADEIDFSDIDGKFVVKTNNGCADVKIIENKSNVDLQEIRTFFKEYMKKPLGIDSAEPHYVRIIPCIIAEQLLDKNKQEIKSTSLVDYKFWCFNGKPKWCFICSNRTKQNFVIDLYTADEQWKQIDEDYLVHDSVHLKSSGAVPKPSKLMEMLEIASKLSVGFPQMRVDMYLVDGKVYVGEITMTSACGRMNYFNQAGLNILGAECGVAYQEILKLEKNNR